MPVDDAVLTDQIIYKPKYPPQLYIHLGVGISDVLGENTTFRMPFSIFANPTVTEWKSVDEPDEPVQDFKIYDDQTHISIKVK